MINRHVCKECRIEYYGDPGWNDFMDAWSDPNYPTRKESPYIYCPAKLILYYLDDSKFLHIKNELTSNLTNKLPNNTWVISEFIQAIDGRLKAVATNLMKQYTQFDPPIWCPYKKEHKNKNNEGNKVNE